MDAAAGALVLGLGVLLLAAVDVAELCGALVAAAGVLVLVSWDIVVQDVGLARKTIEL